VEDSYSMTQGTTLNVAAPGVLGNDTDADGDPLTAAKLSDPANGTLAFNANGSFGYTPNAAFTGSVTFTYRANDGTADSNTATVTITVNPAGGGGTPTTATFTAVEDTFVDSAAPTVNSGAATTVRSYLSGGTEVRSLLKFTVSGLAGAASSAKLRLFVKNGSPAGGAVHGLTSNSWGELTVTWNTMPALGSLLGNIGNAPINTWVEVNVTSAITGNGTFSFAIAGASNDISYYASHEAAQKPELVVTP
jgi:hypothetical protein